MNLKFCPIASGSNGNCSYLSFGKTQILIDAGMSGKYLTSALESINADVKSLDGIFITHEHSDHIKGVGILSRKYNIPIYANKKTWLRIDRHNMIGKISDCNKKLLEKEKDLIVGDIKIKSFEISHDATEPVGYLLECGDFKVSVATDIGIMTDTVKNHISNSDIILLESNHDEDMLNNGRYPFILKKRVLSEKGHLSNVSAGNVLSEIMNKRIKHVFLGHLSEENNTPIMALGTVTSILSKNKITIGKDFNMHLAHRGAVSESIVLTHSS